MRNFPTPPLLLLLLPPPQPRGSNIVIQASTLAVASSVTTSPPSTRSLVLPPQTGLGPSLRARREELSARSAENLNASRTRPATTPRSAPGNPAADLTPPTHPQSLWRT